MDSWSARTNQRALSLSTYLNPTGGFIILSLLLSTLLNCGDLRRIDQRSSIPEGEDSISNPTFLTSATGTMATNDWRNIYGIAWRDFGGFYKPQGVTNRVSYAKQMGYDGVAIGSDWAPHWKNNAAKSGLKFYLLDPELHADHYLGKPAPTGSMVSTTRTYTQAEKDFYEMNMVWKSNAAFPSNLATTFYYNGTDFGVMWDFQQQRVIDMVVDKIVQIALSYQDTGFTFGGTMYDMARIDGHFVRPAPGGYAATGLTYWTGTDSGLTHGSITHDYASFSDGKAAFYKTLNARLKSIFGTQVKWIINPGFIYSTTQYMDEWIYHAEPRSDYTDLRPDLYLVENSALNSFLTEPKIFSSTKIPVTKDMVGAAPAYKSDEDSHRLLAANIGINGSWFNYFGRFEDTPVDFPSIVDVWPRLKLIRCIPNWDNINQVPLSDRVWDGSVYTSKKNGKLQSYISSDVMYSRHPKTRKLFAVFNTLNGKITLNPGEAVVDIKSVDNLFIEASDASADFIISGSQIGLKSSVNIDTHSSGQTQGKGYIITVSP